MTVHIYDLDCLKKKLTRGSAYSISDCWSWDTDCRASSSSFLLFMLFLGFPGGSEVKASACNAGDLGSIPGSGRSPGEGNGNPLQYSWLENPMDGGPWWATVHGVVKSWTRLSDFTH